jgi:transcriptional regulator with XRE-family HTH domain
MLRSVDDATIGRALRALRLSRGWTQETLAARTGISVTRISRVEAGRGGGTSLDALRTLFAALDGRGSFHVRLHGGDLDRLLDARHAAVEEVLVRRFSTLPAWLLDAEATFAIYGERGAIDLLAWHADARAVLIVEIKTELADIGALLRQTDRYRRLAEAIVRPRGWRPRVVGVWVVVADGRTARRRLADHRALLRTAYPSDGHAVAAWLARPEGTLRALSFLPIPRQAQVGRRVPARSSVGRAQTPARSEA